MILPLKKLCLNAVRDGIEKGQIHNPHILPIDLRQLVMEKILNHGTVNDPKCASILGSADFLDGFTSLNFQLGSTDDRRFLDRVAETLKTVLPNGKTLGDGIQELKLNFYMIVTERPRFRSKQQTSLDNIVSVISQCPNLESLGIHAVKYFERFTRDGTKSKTVWSSENDAFMNSLGSFDFLSKSGPFAPCLAIVENLQKLSLITRQSHNLFFYLLDYRKSEEMIEFKNLKSLQLINVWIENRGAWYDFLETIEDSLEHLHYEFGIADYYNILPDYFNFHLKTLIVEPSPTDIAFFENLRYYPELEYVKLDIDASSLEDDSIFTELESIMIAEPDLQMDIQMRMIISGDPGLFDGSSRFKVRVIGEKIKSIDLTIHTWNKTVEIAMKDLIDSLQNLDHLRLRINDIPAEQQHDMENVFMPLFENERAKKIRTLTSYFDFGRVCFPSIFKNCTNLNELVVRYNSWITDDHLINLTNRGGKLTKIEIVNCANIRDEGLIPMVITSGENLITFMRYGRHDNHRAYAERLWKVVFDRCPDVQIIEGFPKDMKKLMDTKLNKKLRDGGDEIMGWRFFVDGR